MWHDLAHDRSEELAIDHALGPVFPGLVPAGERGALLSAAFCPRDVMADLVDEVQIAHDGLLVVAARRAAHVGGEVAARDALEHLAVQPLHDVLVRNLLAEALDEPGLESGSAEEASRRVDLDVIAHRFVDEDDLADISSVHGDLSFHSLWISSPTWRERRAEYSKKIKKCQAGLWYGKAPPTGWRGLGARFRWGTSGASSPQRDQLQGGYDARGRRVGRGVVRAH